MVAASSLRGLAVSQSADFHFREYRLGGRNAQHSGEIWVLMDFDGEECTRHSERRWSPVETFPRS